MGLNLKTSMAWKGRSEVILRAVAQDVLTGVGDFVETVNVVLGTTRLLSG